MDGLLNRRAVLKRGGRLCPPLQAGTPALLMCKFPLLLAFSIAGCSPREKDSRVKSSDIESPPHLIVACAAVLKPFLDDAMAQSAAAGTPLALDVRYGGSGTLLASMRAGRPCDLFLSADDVYIEDAIKDGLLHEKIEIAPLTAVIAVRADSGKSIQTWADLLQPGVRVALALPETAAIGRCVQLHLEERGLWRPLLDHATVTMPTVADAMHALTLGGVDAAIVWDVMLVHRENMVEVRLSELEGATATAAIGCSSRAGAREVGERLATAFRRSWPTPEAAKMPLEPKAMNPPEKP